MLRGRKLLDFALSDRAKIASGEWVTPSRRQYRMICCDCGLVHRYQFRLVRHSSGGSTIQFRCWRDERLTAAIRRRRKA